MIFSCPLTGLMGEYEARGGRVRLDYGRYSKEVSGPAGPVDIYLIRVGSDFILSAVKAGKGADSSPLIFFPILGPAKQYVASCFPTWTNQFQVYKAGRDRRYRK